MKARFLLWTVPIVGVLAIVALFVVGFPSVGAYWRFLSHGSAYYSAFAGACDTVIRESSQTPDEIRGSRLQSLPKAIRDLDPDTVIVRSNLVLVGVGSGLLSHKIVWAESDLDTNLWQLKIYPADSGAPRLLYTRERFAQ